MKTHESPTLARRQTEVERLSFADWIQAVIAEMETGYGLHPGDLPDCTYADWHALGLEPHEAVQEAVALCAGVD